MGPVDQEAVAAADDASQRTASQAEREARTTAEARCDRTATRDTGETSSRRRAEGAAVTAEAAAADADEGGTGRFSGLVTVVAKGKGAKKRKVLAERLAMAWHEAEREGLPPSVAVPAVYRRMVGVMTAKVVKTMHSGPGRLQQSHLQSNKYQESSGQA